VLSDAVLADDEFEARASSMALFFFLQSFSIWFGPWQK
jgi:hypothetical protein